MIDATLQGFTAELTDEPTWLVDPLGIAQPLPTILMILYDLSSCCACAAHTTTLHSAGAAADGTTNFVHRFPFVCVSIALAINKKVRLVFMQTYIAFSVSRVSQT